MVLPCSTNITSGYTPLKDGEKLKPILYFQGKEKGLCLNKVNSNAIALVFEGQSLTYQELNARSNQLAHHLASLCIGGGMGIAMVVESL